MEATVAEYYKTINDFYNNMIIASLVTPQVSPWLSTATYWVLNYNYGYAGKNSL